MIYLIWEEGGKIIQVQRIQSIVFVLITTLLLCSCASLPNRNPLPESLADKAHADDIPDIRFWGDEVPAQFEEWFEMPQADFEAQNSGIIGREHHYLALSGGGENGAFGAGFLVGWTATGFRPEFTIVTGVSTGALMAPFAFLGPDYDVLLKEFYTTYTAADLFEKQNWFEIITGDSIASSEPLQKIIAKYFDNKLMQAVAAEYRRGRELYIGTTNLDASRPVIWNIGRIAACGSPKALALIHKVILASASIPIGLPPVYIEVSADGQTFDEMHVDGGATNQIFLFPNQVNWKLISEKLRVKGKPNSYLIRNARIKPKWEAVKPSFISIAISASSSLIRTQGIGDMYRLYARAKRDDFNYHLAYIPDDFDLQPKGMGDIDYMVKLFNRGYELAQSKSPWEETPPGLKIE